MSRRRRAFTLIELLVVIAIIGILAAMVFPVFARARESARKTVCLSGVKNIALALQMYLSDYDQTPPGEHNSEIFAYFAGEGVTCYDQVVKANPYLRWPVILDEYVRNRSVWACPSAAFGSVPNLIVGEYYGTVYDYWMDSKWQTNWGYFGPCHTVYPPGWGGNVTDSHNQYDSGWVFAAGGFEQSIGTNGYTELNTSQMDDVSRFVAIADSSCHSEILNAQIIAYPDACRVGCTNNPECSDSWCVEASDTSCVWQSKYNTDKTEARRFTRHLGGSNIGFMDGHAIWMRAEAILAEAPRHACGCQGGGPVDRWLLGLEAPFPTTAAGSPENGVAEGEMPSIDNCGTYPVY